MIPSTAPEWQRPTPWTRCRQAISARRVNLLASACLAALSLLFFWKIALTNQILTGLDLFGYFYPYRDYVSECLRHGRLPLWNPYLFMGAPLLANSQAAVLYPLHWPLLWLSAPKQVTWSIVLHVWWAGAGSFLYARRVLRLRPHVALVPAVAFAFGGFIGAQVEHINQLNASAWLPWLLLLLDTATSPRNRRLLTVLGGGLVVGLVLLAGHTQAAYIVLVGCAADAVFKGLLSPRKQRLWTGLRGLGMLACMTVIGIALAAGQLLPTLELSRLSVRSGGLPYQEAASFSLKPTLIFKALLPPLIWEPPFSEYVAYVGLTGLALAAVGIWYTLLRLRRPEATRPDEHALSPAENDLASAGSKALALVLLGLFLAFGAYNPVYYLLYRLVPGFDLFRAPARWLLLYSFGMANLAGIGLEKLARGAAISSVRPCRMARFLRRIEQGPGVTAVVLLLAVELWTAGRRLNYNHPTAPLAFDSMRTAPAHLLADTGPEPFRFLSISDIRYDPGDLKDLQVMFGSYLSERALYDLLVATKMKEVLAFNLPLRYRLFSVDGYDGGLLPIAQYVTLEKLFLPESEIWPDGRLRQQLRQVPPARLLSLLNVKYVITDKTQDVWIDDAYYDLEHTVPLGEVALTELPEFEATHLGLVSYLTDTAELPDGTPVAQVVVTDTGGTSISITLQAGEHTAEGMYDSRPVAHRQARVAHPWRDHQPGVDYVAILDLGRRIRPSAIVIRSLLPDNKVHLRGLTLIDRVTDTSRSVTIEPSYRLVHSGDVKIYQNLKVLPRAFVVHQASIVPDPETALALLQDPGFDPASKVILEQGTPLTETKGTATVRIARYEPEWVEFQVELDTPGYLVLTDTDYPGWTADVDGQSVPIRRANLYFRAVALEPGSHRVTFRFRPHPVRLGLGVSLASWLAWSLAAVLACKSHIGPERITSV